MKEKAKLYFAKFVKLKSGGVKFDSRGATTILQDSGIESHETLGVVDVIELENYKSLIYKSLITGSSLVEYSAPDTGGVPYFVEP